MNSASAASSFTRNRAIRRVFRSTAICPPTPWTCILKGGPHREGCAADADLAARDRLLRGKAKFMNREQDMNEESLRHAKRSLDPERFLPSATSCAASTGLQSSIRSCRDRVMRSSFPLLLSLLFSAIAGLTIQRYLFDLRSLDPVYGQLHFYPDTARPLPGYAGLLCGFALFTVLPLRHGNFSALAAFNRRWQPLLLTLPLLAFKTAAFLRCC